MRQPLLLLSLGLIAACGRNDVDLRPTPTEQSAPALAPGQAPASAGDQAVLPPAPQFPKPNDKALSFDLKLARDSAADEAVLENLADAAPKDELPDVPIDAASTRELNVAAFADQPRVQYYVDFFAQRMHDRFQIWLDRMPRFETYA